MTCLQMTPAFLRQALIRYPEFIQQLDPVPESLDAALRELFELDREGLEVLPCGRHECDPRTGRCSGRLSPRGIEGGGR